MNIIEKKLSRELTHTVPHSSLVSHCSLEELGCTGSQCGV